MSIFAPALNTLHSLDIMFDSSQREFVLGKKRIIVPVRAMRKGPAINNSGAMVSYFDADDEAYEALNAGDADDLKIHDNTVELRVEPHLTGINGELSILCAQVGFDPGVLSFDKASGLKTATEVISENSKTFGTVSAHENNITDALKEMVHAIFDLAARYGIEWEGQSVEKLISGGYDVSVKFDDSIIQDRQTDLNEGAMLVGAGLMSKKRFMVETLGLTPEDADKELAQIKEEGAGNMIDVSRIYGSME
jgi:A118 family predicted phage portal protein